MISQHGQATKSTRGMPWHQEPMKDATNCDKPRGAVSGRYYPWISEWSNPVGVMPDHHILNKIGI